MEAGKLEGAKASLISAQQKLVASQVLCKTSKEEVKKVKEKEQSLVKEMEKKFHKLEDKVEAAQLKVCNTGANYEALNEEMDKKEADIERSEAQVEYMMQVLRKQEKEETFVISTLEKQTKGVIRAIFKEDLQPNSVNILLELLLGRIQSRLPKDLADKLLEEERCPSQAKAGEKKDDNENNQVITTSGSQEGGVLHYKRRESGNSKQDERPADGGWTDDQRSSTSGEIPASNKSRSRKRLG